MPSIPTVKFSNPRLTAVFDDWPSGGNRVKCKFEVETDPKRGQRVSRTTTNQFGHWLTPKHSTFAVKCCIVNGDDGKTYILRDTKYGFISIDRHDFKSADPGSVFKNDSPTYNELLTLINSAK